MSLIHRQSAEVSQTIAVFAVRRKLEEVPHRYLCRVLHDQDQASVYTVVDSDVCYRPSPDHCQRAASSAQECVGRNGRLWAVGRRGDVNSLLRTCEFDTLENWVGGELDPDVHVEISCSNSGAVCPAFDPQPNPQRAKYRRA